MTFWKILLPDDVTVDVIDDVTVDVIVDVTVDNQIDELQHKVNSCDCFNYLKSQFKTS